MPIADDRLDDVPGRPGWARGRVRLTRRRILLLGTAGAGATALAHAAASAAVGARRAISLGRPRRGAGSAAICATCGELGHAMLRCPHRLLP